MNASYNLLYPLGKVKTCLLLIVSSLYCKKFERVTYVYIIRLCQSNSMNCLIYVLLKHVGFLNVNLSIVTYDLDNHV